MNLADTLRVLLRRWYLTLPAILLTIAAGIGAFLVVEPTYERSANLLMLPDAASIPDDANPYLYLSGLSPVADVLVRASASQEFLDEVTGGVSGSGVSIVRDYQTSSPVIVITASAAGDDVAATMLDETIAHVTDTLGKLQSAEGISAGRRLSIQTLTVDTNGTVVQRTRLLVTGLVVVGGLVLAIVLPTAVEGLTRRRRHRAAPEAAEADAEEPTSPDDVDEQARPDDVDEPMEDVIDAHEPVGAGAAVVHGPPVPDDEPAVVEAPVVHARPGPDDEPDGGSPAPPPDLPREPTRPARVHRKPRGVAVKGPK